MTTNVVIPEVRGVALLALADLTIWGSILH